MAIYQDSNNVVNNVTNNITNKGGQSPSEAAKRTKGVMVHIGDSNTNGRPGYKDAYSKEWIGTGGLFDGWTSYNVGQNGSTLEDWSNLEITRLTDPSYKDLPPVDYTPTNQPNEGRLARAINANADIYIISLGTNDLNNPNSRASIGTEANLRINLAKLISALLTKTQGAILLRLPQPFANEDFLGITQWVNSAEVQEANRRLRIVYREWKGINSRVDVYDSHQSLFGDNCEDRTINCQDPYLISDTANPSANDLIVDGLHLTTLGYLRVVQQIGVQLVGGNINRKIAPKIISSLGIVGNAVWSTNLYIRSGVVGSGSGTLVYVDADYNSESAIIGQSYPLAPNVANEGKGTVDIVNSSSAVPLLELPAKLGNLNNSYRSLLAVPDKSRLYAYSHATGVTTQLSNISVAQAVGVSRPYVQFAVSGANLSGFGGGTVTFYTVDTDNIPFIGGKILTYTARENPRHCSLLIGRGKIGTITDIQASRAPSPSGSTLEIKLSNQADNRYITGTENFGGSGKQIGTIPFGSYVNEANLIWNTTNFPDKRVVLLSGSRVVAYSNLGDFVGGYYDLVFTASD